MKHILSVQDLSCVGRCSLTVTLPVLSAMGIRCSVLPTAVLSTHTGFPDPAAVSLTDSLSAFADHWQKNGITFDAISVGYLSDPVQARSVLQIAEQFACPLILDPVMGDNGRLYSRITGEHFDAMRSLCARARVILPNLTEAAALSETVYRDFPTEEQQETLLLKLRELGAQNVLITGIPALGNTLGFAAMTEDNALIRYQAPRIPRHFHGTGDLFAAVFAGCFVSGMDLMASGREAADFVRLCVEKTPAVTPHGVEFEPELGVLTRKFCS